MAPAVYSQWVFADLPIGRLVGASGLLSPAGRVGSVAAAAGAPWLVLLQGLSVFWERRRRRKS